MRSEPKEIKTINVETTDESGELAICLYMVDHVYGFNFSIDDAEKLVMQLQTAIRECYESHEVWDE